MVADAAARSWVGLVWMQAVLRLPQPIVSVSGGVVGFEACSLISCFAAWRCLGSSRQRRAMRRPRLAMATMPIGKAAAAR
jgi:hypothetical protein